jgi:hypothetical protein
MRLQGQHSERTCAAEMPLSAFWSGMSLKVKGWCRRKPRSCSICEAPRACFQRGAAENLEIPPRSWDCQFPPTDPTLAEAHDVLGGLLEKQGRLDAALVEYREAVRKRGHELLDRAGKPVKSPDKNHVELPFTATAC